MNNFGARQDSEIVNRGGFFCSGCLVSHPAEEQSPDPRYCQCAYRFLLEEAKTLNGRKPSWVPKDYQTINRKPPKPVEQEIKWDKIQMGSQMGCRNMSQAISGKSTVKNEGRIGRKSMTLPLDRIKELSNAGFSSRLIAARLEVEHGIQDSYRTVQRVLSSER